MYNCFSKKQRAMVIIIIQNNFYLALKRFEINYHNHLRCALLKIKETEETDVYT